MTTTIDHGTDAWHAERATGIGGSEIGVILGLSSFESPFSLWARKTGLLPAGDPETARQRIGRRMEGVIAAEFHDATGLHVAGEQLMLRHPDHPWARASVDGLVVESPHSAIDDAVGVFEAKTAREFGWTEIPPTYLAQCRWNAWVAGVDRAWLCVMFSGWRFEVFEIDQDPADVAFMVDRAAEFWAHVENGTPPPVDGHDATADAIAHLWPTETPDKAIDADPTLAEILAHRAAIKARVSADEKVLKGLDNELAALIGDAETIRIDGAPAFTYRAQSRTTVDRAALEAEHPAIAAAFTRISTYRVLRPVKGKK